MAHIQIDDELFKKLRQKVVVITGGSSGIGLAILKLLSRNGALIVNGDLRPTSGWDVQECSSVTFQKTDVSKWADLCSLFSRAEELHGHVDHVFANTGIPPRTTYMDLQMDQNGRPLEPSHQVLDVNLKSLINTVALTVHHIKKSTHGDGDSKVITGSASSFQRYPPTDYTVSKYGVLGLMRGLYPNLRLQNLPIRINTILPSWTETGMVPGDLLRSLGIAWQPAEAVAGAVGLLMADEKRDGQAIFIEDGVSREVEEAILVKVACQIYETDELNTTEEYIKMVGRRPSHLA